MQPSIVFVDTGRWTCFDQFGATLRRLGYRTIRVSIERSRLSRLMSRMEYDEFIVIDSPDRLRRLDEILDSRNVVDVQCTEAVLRDLCSGLSTSGLPAHVGDHLLWRAEHLDKYTMSERLASVGVRVPTILSAATTTPAQAVDQLGLPLVIKGRVGFGGSQVLLAHDLDAAIAAVETLGGDDSLYFEKYVAGDIIRYVSCRTDSEILEEATFVAHRKDPSSLGPATGIELVHDPDMVELGRATLEALGGRGFANIEAVRDADGSLWVIDVNLRVWGSALALRGAGIDFVSAYRRSLGETVDSRAVVAAAATTAGACIEVFPDSAIATLATESILAASIVFATSCSTYLRWAGARYVLSASALFLATAVKTRLLPRGRRALTPPVR